MFQLYIIFAIIAHVCFSQNASNFRRSYYFKMGKTENEFKVNSQIHFLNHNITDYDYSHKPRVNIKHQNFNNDSTYFIDKEWNFNHQNITRTELPLFIQKFYEAISPKVKSVTRILFNENRNSSSSIIKFNLESLRTDEAILEAEFYFYWPLDSNSGIYRESVVLRLYQLESQSGNTLNESTLAENPDVHKLFNVIYISKAQKGWQVFKIKKSIDNWLNGEDNLGLLLTISGYEDNNLISIFNDTNEGIYRSFAVITAGSNETVINDQLKVEETQTQGIKSCKKNRWIFSFKKLHWNNFIIAPNEFVAYDCNGGCINSETDGQVNHVKLLRISNKRPACCVPVNYIPLPVMFYDKYNNIVIKNYENMIVKECGCR